MQSIKIKRTLPECALYVHVEVGSSFVHFFDVNLHTLCEL